MAGLDHLNSSMHLFALGIVVYRMFFMYALSHVNMAYVLHLELDTVCKPR